MICAAVVKIVDLGIDRALEAAVSSEPMYFYGFASVVEFLLDSSSTVLAGDSLKKTVFGSTASSLAGRCCA